RPCRKGGWQHLYRSDGSTFKNQDECVTYAKRGGTLLTSPPAPPPPSKPKAQLDCESFGGTFTSGPSPNYEGYGQAIWSCAGWSGGTNSGSALSNDCFADTPGVAAAFGPVRDLDPQNSSCVQSP